MMNRILNLTRVLFLTATCLSFILPKTLAESRHCRILFLGAPTQAPNHALLHDGTKAQPVELPRMNFSPVYPIASGNLTLYLLPRDFDVKNPIPPQAPSISIPETIDDCYLLCRFDPQRQPLPIALQVIDSSSHNFHRGQMMWFNLTPYAVGGSVGSQQLAMHPQSRVMLDAPATKNEDYLVNLSYIREKEIRQPLCETKWQHNPETRTVIFVFTEANRRIPRVMGFPDFRSQPAASP